MSPPATQPDEALSGSVPLTSRAALVNQLHTAYERGTFRIRSGLGWLTRASRPATQPRDALHWFRMLPERVGLTRPEAGQHA